MNVFAAPVMLAAAAVSAPAFWGAFVDGTTEPTTAFTRFAVCALLAWAGMTVVLMIVGPAPRSETDALDGTPTTRRRSGPPPSDTARRARASAHSTRASGEVAEQLEVLPVPVGQLVAGVQRPLGLHRHARHHRLRAIVPVPSRESGSGHGASYSWTTRPSSCTSTRCTSRPRPAGSVATNAVGHGPSGSSTQRFSSHTSVRVNPCPSSSRRSAGRSASRTRTSRSLCGRVWRCSSASTPQPPISQKRTPCSASCRHSAAASVAGSMPATLPRVARCQRVAAAGKVPASMLARVETTGWSVVRSTSGPRSSS